MGLVSKKLQTSISRFQFSPCLIPDPLWRVDGPENEINHQWLMIQPIYLFSEPVEEIHKNWAQRACGLMNTGSWYEAVLTRTQRLGTPPSFCACTSLPFFCLKFYFGNASNGFPKFSHWFYWVVEFEDGVMDPQSSILIIWSQAWLTWDLMAAIWTEEFSALNLQNLQ